MRIKSIWAENWKSFGARSPILLGPLTLLVGPNNAGKTNALNILAAIQSFVRNAGNYSQSVLSNIRTGDSEARFGLAFQDRDGREGKYEIGVGDGARAEHFGSSDFEFSVSPDGLLTSRFGSGGLGSASGLRHVAAQGWSRAANDLVSRLDSYAVWRLDPSAIDQAVPVERRVRIEPNGSRAAAMLDHLRDKYPKAFAALQDDLRNCAPEIASVVAEASDNPGQKEIFFNETGGISVPSRGASEGLKFLLFVLLVLHSPDPPRLFAIEEIEHGVHPRRIRDIVSFLRQLTVSSQVQILLTSHSPLVVDQFSDSPEEVVVVERNSAGTTECTPLPEKLKEIHGKSPDAGLGDLWFSGVLGGVPAP